MIGMQEKDALNSERETPLMMCHDTFNQVHPPPQKKESTTRLNYSIARLHLLLRPSCQRKRVVDVHMACSLSLTPGPQLENNQASGEPSRLSALPCPFQKKRKKGDFFILAPPLVPTYMRPRLPHGVSALAHTIWSLTACPTSVARSSCGSGLSLSIPISICPGRRSPIRFASCRSQRTARSRLTT